MTDEGDRKLLEQFRALRREAGAGGGAPEFRGIVAGLARRRERTARARRRVLGVAAVAAAAAALVLFAVVRLGGKRAVLVDLASARWESPTDFLLRTPGAELLRAMPTFTAGGRMLP